MLAVSFTKELYNVLLDFNGLIWVSKGLNELIYDIYLLLWDFGTAVYRPSVCRVILLGDLSVIIGHLSGVDRLCHRNDIASL